MARQGTPQGRGIPAENVEALQDILGLGEEARMNTPGKQSGNWLKPIG